MLVIRIIAVGMLFGLFAGAAHAANAGPRVCLNKAEQRAAVADKKAIPLAKAMQNRRAKGHFAELVRARLCHRDERLVYVLTLLGRSGRVISETVDAASGDLINER